MWGGGVTKPFAGGEQEKGKQMQNEEITNKTISVTTRSAENALRFLAKHGYSGFKMLRSNHSQNKEIRKSQKQQSYKQLAGSGQGLSAVKLNESEDISVFAKAAKEYKLGFAVKKDKETSLYTLFFRSKDKEVYDRVFEKYAKMLEKDGKKKSLRKELAEKKAEAKRINEQRVKNAGRSIEKEIAK